MNYWFIYLIAILAGVLSFLSADSLANGAMAAGVVGAIALLVPLLMNLLKKRIQIASSLPALLGFLLALASVGLAHPLFGQQPAYVLWAVVAALGSFSSYAFYLYQNEVGFAAPASKGKEVEVKPDEAAGPKILDTSIVIDGRIIDLAATGFIEGALVVPNFVLREIQLISDSPDPIKRNRGRRGLDMLNQLQKREDLEIRISYKDYTETREVDAKLVRLARELGGKLITNDFNLNKVAELQGVPVLNINNLANALKPVVLPGEEMDIQVVKEGKDENQGIGYLDDGTMVVIENGGKLLNKKVRVSVTSVIQTNAGKMIFTKVVPRN